MPLAAMSLSMSRTVRMATCAASRAGRAAACSRRAVAVAGVAAVAGATAFMWWPNGDYEPIRPGEKGTIGEAVRSVPAIASGRPAFTPERAQQLRVGADASASAPRRRASATAATAAVRGARRPRAGARRRGLRRRGRSVHGDDGPATPAAARPARSPRPARRHEPAGDAHADLGPRPGALRPRRPPRRRPTPPRRPPPRRPRPRPRRRRRPRPRRRRTPPTPSTGEPRRRHAPTQAPTADPTPVPTP